MTLGTFAQVVGREDIRIDLSQACLMIAQDAYPSLDVERYLGKAANFRILVITSREYSLC